MKKQIILSWLLTCWITSGLWATNGFTLPGEGTYGTALSPNGRYMVGIGLSNRIFGLYSTGYLYDLQNKTLTWLTSFDENDYGKAGQFDGVNDAGMICGTAKDPSHVISWNELTGPINVATVWNNGNITRLPYGNLDMSAFKQLEDGTYATALTEDGKTVVGYSAASNFAYLKPCKWTQDADGTWKMEQLPMPEGGKNGRAIDISADGKVIVGTVQIEWNNYAVFWKNGECFVVHCIGNDEELEDYCDMKVFDLSPNGRYFTFTLSSSMYYRIYDINNNSYKPLPTFDEEGSVETMAIDNQGNVAGVACYGFYEYDDNAYNRPFYYRYSTDRLFDLTYIMSFFAPEVKPDFSLNPADKTQAIPFAISADGTTIGGNKDIYVSMGQTPQSWLLQMDLDDRLIPSKPEVISAVSKTLRQVTITWKKDLTTYESLTLKSYRIYENNHLRNTVTPDSETLEVTLDEVASGFPSFTVEAVFEDALGHEVCSPRSDARSVAVPENFDLPFFDDFDRENLQDNYWVRFVEQGSESDAVWGTAPYVGYQGSAALVAGTNVEQTYSNGVVSRLMDATKAKYVALSFYYFSIAYGTPQAPDAFAVEVSTDFGNTWTVVDQHLISELPTVQTMKYVNLTDYVADKMFILRLRKFGEGKMPYYIYIDNLKITTEPEREAPQGIIGEERADGSVRIAWKDASNSYPLSYVRKMNEKMLTLGNAGSPLIGANAFDQDELRLYDGKYLTAIGTMINQYSNLKDDKGIQASIVVFEDGKLVREQEIDNLLTNTHITVMLDEPLKIDASKELKIGVKVHDYDSRQIPLLYVNNDAFVAGKSDLFSEDNGTTWQSLNKFYTDNNDPDRGKCSWYIFGHITDEPTFTLSPDASMLMGYNVMRNGVVINDLFLLPYVTSFDDTAPLDKVCYEVMAYYGDGNVSDFSEQYCRTVDGIDECGHASGVVYRQGRYLMSSLPSNGMALFNLDGRQVRRSPHGKLSLNGIAAGVYVVNVYHDNRITSLKIVIR
ncbi:MAG: Por secretion system protein [Prevotellaceae bacterium]|nr:Por secretion system protein [Prevotella sp.]MDD7530904.1 Por secretion system protein [Prevotellaceae bacterium]